MTNLTGRKPYQKTGKPKKDERFLNEIRSRRCIICQTFNEPQFSPTQAHHPIMDRFGTRKSNDKEAIPLCEGHHQGMFDTSKTAIHHEPKKWRELYGPDWEYSDQTTEL